MLDTVNNKISIWEAGARRKKKRDGERMRLSKGLTKEQRAELKKQRAKLKVVSDLEVIGGGDDARIVYLNSRAIKEEKIFVDEHEPHYFVTFSFRYETNKDNAQKKVRLFLAKMARKNALSQHLKVFYYGDVQPLRLQNGELAWHYHVFLWLENGLTGKSKLHFRKWRYGNSPVAYDYDDEQYGVFYSIAKHRERGIDVCCPQIERKCRKTFGGKCKYEAKEEDRVKGVKARGRRSGPVRSKPETL